MIKENKKKILQILSFYLLIIMLLLIFIIFEVSPYERIFLEETQEEITRLASEVDSRFSTINNTMISIMSNTKNNYNYFAFNPINNKYDTARLISLDLLNIKDRNPSIDSILFYYIDNKFIIGDFGIRHIERHGYERFTDIIPFADLQGLNGITLTRPRKAARTSIGSNREEILTSYVSPIPISGKSAGIKGYFIVNIKEYALNRLTASTAQYFNLCGYVYHNLP